MTTTVYGNNTNSEYTKIIQHDSDSDTNLI